MLELLAAWALFPAVLVVITLGCGLLVERLARVTLPGVLLAPTGLAVVFVEARLVTESERVSELALPLLVLLAVAGIVLGRERLRGARPDVWAAAAAVGVFAVLGAPVFFTGDPTIAGSIVLPDTANQLAIASFVNDHGHNWQDLAQSSYRTILRKYLATAYPIAAQSAVGTVRPLGLIDLAWLYQPFLTFAVSMMSLSFYSLLSPWIRPRVWRALAAFIVAQPAILVGFAMQGSIKEITGASMAVLAAAHAARAEPSSQPVGVLLPFALAVAAALGVIGAPAAAYMAPLVLGVFAVWAFHALRSGSRAQLFGLGAAVLVGLVAMLPVVASARTALHNANTVLSHAGDLGNLAAPLKARQVTGIWLNGDYRYSPQGADVLGWILIVAVVAAAALGVAWMIRRRAVGPLLVVVSIGLVSIPLAVRGSPYADAKVLAVAAPAVLMAAALGVWALHSLWRGIPAIALAALLAGGVLLSNAKAYHDSRHAPFHRYAELIEINDRFSGQGPAESNEYDEYGSYLLRDLPGWVEPERYHQWRTPALPTSPARRPFLKATHDVDALLLDYVEKFPLLVLRRGPVTARPPANYRRVFHGHYYDVWRRGSDPTVRFHLPLGDGLRQAGGKPGCGAVRRMARAARRIGGHLAYVEAQHTSELLPLDSKHPRYWLAYPGWPKSVSTVSQGDSKSTVLLRERTRYTIWMEGSFGRRFTVYVDGRKVGSAMNEEGNPGGHLLVGTVTLAPGLHEVRAASSGGDLRPGNGGSESSLRHLGPVVFSPAVNEARTVRYVSPSRAESTLCGRSLDWVEIVD